MKQAFSVSLLFLLIAPFTYAEILTFSVDDYCPYYCKGDGQAIRESNPGFVIDILEQAFKPKDYQLKYVTRPWERGIKEVREGKFNALIIAAKGDAPKLVFPENEQGRSVGCYYTQADNPWQFTDMTSLKGKKLGLVKGYEYYEPLNTFLMKNINDSNIRYLSGQTVMARILNMINLGRLDLTMEDANVADHLILQLGMVGKIKKSTCAKGELDFFVAFSPAKFNSKKHAEILSKAMDTFRRNGQLKKILEKYGVSDWR